MQEKTPVKLEQANQEVGARIRKLRIQQGLTQQEFCTKNQLKTAANLSDIEKGKTFATVATLLRICANNNVSADSLLFGSRIQAIKDDSEAFRHTQTAMNALIRDYDTVLRSEEARLQQELNQAVEKRDHLALLIQAASAGAFDHEKGDIHSVGQDLRFAKDYIGFLQGDLDQIRERSKRFSDYKATLLAVFG